MRERARSGCVPIIHGGGWTAREIVGRPKTRFCGFLSVIWLFVFLPALILLWALWSSPVSPDWATWLCVILLIPEPLFLLFAFFFRLFEKPRTITVPGHPRMGRGKGMVD